MRPTTHRAFARLRVETRLSERDRRNSDRRLSLAVGLVKVIIAWRAEFLWNRAMNGVIIEFPFTWTTLIFVLNVLLIWKIWQGRNWARFAVFIIFAIGVWRAVADTVVALSPESGLHILRPLAILQVVQVVIFGYALSLIFTDQRASAGFSPKRYKRRKCHHWFVIRGRCRCRNRK